MFGVHVMGYRVPFTAMLAGVVGLVIATALYFGLRRCGWRRGRATLTAAAVWMYLAVLAIALSPSSSNAVVVGSCAIGEIDMLGWLHDDQRLLNVLMYVPLTVIGLLAAATMRRRIIVLVLLAVTPPVVEGLQSSSLIGRSCDVHDVVDNWVGVLGGAVIAGFVLLLTRGRLRDSTTHPTSNGRSGTFYDHP